MKLIVAIAIIAIYAHCASGAMAQRGGGGRGGGSPSAAGRGASAPASSPARASAPTANRSTAPPSVPATRSLSGVNNTANAKNLLPPGEGRVIGKLRQSTMEKAKWGTTRLGNVVEKPIQQMLKRKFPTAKMTMNKARHGPDISLNPGARQPNALRGSQVLDVKPHTHSGVKKLSKQVNPWGLTGRAVTYDANGVVRIHPTVHRPNKPKRRPVVRK